MEPLKKYDPIIRKRERRWNLFFEKFNKPSRAPLLSLSIDQLKNVEEFAPLQNAMHQEISVSRAKLSKKLFSPHSSNKVQGTDRVDNNTVNTAEESSNVCLAVTEINRSLLQKEESHDSGNSLDILEENCQKTVKCVQGSKTPPDNNHCSSTQGDETAECKELKIKVFRSLELEFRLSNEEDRSEKPDGDVSKKATSRIGDVVEHVASTKESSETLACGSTDEYLQYINEFHEGEENPDAIIAKIKSMKRFTRGKYKMAKFVMRFLRRSGQQNTVDYANAHKSLVEQLKIMRKRFGSFDISLYDEYLDWLYDKRRKF